MSKTGTFYGIGVGPGEPALLPVVAWNTLQRCQIVYVPRASSQEASTAKACLPAHAIPEERFREIEFDMSKDHSVLSARYSKAAEEIAVHLRKGEDVAFLTLGDTMTFSTFNYQLRAVRDACPEAPWRVFPGVTSYAALAACTGFALGEGKERVQILPCPEEAAALKRAIEVNDIVILMKIGKRLPMVVALLEEMNLLRESAFGSRVGMPEAVCVSGIEPLLLNPSSGYLSTILIRNPSPRPL
jgi:precorrin-2/cobalt-factor-2 C20-methyltransferase